MKNLMFALVVGFFCISAAYSVNITEIESVRLRIQGASSELTSSDKSVIAKFWTEALNQMLLSKSSNEIVEIRRQLESQKGDDFLSYYATAYIAQAKTDIQEAFQNVDRLEDSQQRQMLEQNLMILTANLQSPQLAPLALQQLDDKDAVVRYWAFKAVTQAAIIQQLTSEVTRDEQATEAILDALGTQAANGLHPEIQKMIVSFCAAFNQSKASDILLTIANKRIAAYRNWTVNDESPDAVLLTVLGATAEQNSNPEVKKVFGRTFAELYAVVIQRYSQGKDTFSSEQIDRLLTVIAEVDQSVLDKIMGFKTGILAAIKRGQGLDAQYETLLGNQMLRGQLAEKFKFDYGKDASGKSLSAPPKLEPMPEKLKTQD
ncbi:MAG: hypothetical protein OEV87_08640 [Phycisphaerae bacterium]|nr:hypothetical protein [Phycisphaerae bacterium]